MKRSILFALTAVLLLACGKTDPEAPTIAWPANTNFARVELGTGVDASITVNAPAKIESLTMALGLGDFAMLANPRIGIAANKGNSNKAPLFDVIDDPTVAEFLNGLGMTAGTGLRGLTIGVLNMENLLNALIAGQPISNNTTFTIDIELIDQTGRVVNKVAKFHFTSPPTITWTDNAMDEIVDLNKYSPSKPGPSKVRIQAPGKVKELTATLESSCSPELADYVKNRTSGGTTVIDLINDSNAQENFKFPAASKLSGKTDVSLDFSFVYSQIPDLSPATNVFKVKVVDSFGKETIHPLRFKK